MTQEEFHKRYHYNPSTDCLGEGGFGKVFKAYDTHRDRWVAIKMAEVKPQFEEVRLKKEVEIISKFSTHPNIAYYEDCYTFSTFAGVYDFGILQYYESGNLEQLMSSNSLSYVQKDSILRQILAGIEFLHSNGIIHRDLKPQNILIVNRNGEYIPKITDFGISKKLDINKSSVFTNSIAGAGTLSFASPEQLFGQTIKKNSDLWSFGVIAYFVLLGKLPFNSGNETVTSEVGRIELFKQITKGEIPELIEQIDEPWKELIKKCLEPSNEKRINNASECLIHLGERTDSKEIGPEMPGNATEIAKPKVTVVEKSKKAPRPQYFKWKYVAAIIILPILIWVLANMKYSSPKQIYPNDKTVTDIDGNVYHTVTIGSQTWMVENLATTRFRNGEEIQNIETFRNHKFYPWEAVIDGRNIAPQGWRVGTDKDWTILENYLIENGYTSGWKKNSKAIAKALATKTSWKISLQPGSKIFGSRIKRFFRWINDEINNELSRDLQKNNKSGFSAVGAGYFRKDNVLPGNRSFNSNAVWWSPANIDEGPKYRSIGSAGSELNKNSKSKLGRAKILLREVYKR